MTTIQLRKYGQKGKNGGNGGKGGAGGFCGKYGKIHINNDEKKNENHINKRCKGYNGEPGRPGKSGKNGDFVIVEIQITDSGTVKTGVQYINDLEKLKNGLVNSEINIDNQTLSMESKLKIFEIETEYFKFLNKTNNIFKESKLLERDFVKNLTRETLQTERPNIIELIDRIEVLGDLKYPFIFDFVQKIGFSADASYDRENLLKLLNYTIISAATSIIQYNKQKESVLVIDIKTFLNLVIQEVNEMKRKNFLIVREFTKINFEKSSLKRIEEAKFFIERLQEDIEGNDNKMNENIKNVLKEINMLKINVEANGEELKIKKKELNKALTRKKFTED